MKTKSNKNQTQEEKEEIKPTKPKEKQKKPKRIPKYKAFSCFRWMMFKLWEWDRTIALTAVAIIPLAVAMYALNLYIPSIVLDKLANSKTFSPVVWVIVLLLTAQLVFKLITNLVDSYRGTSRLIINNMMSYMIFVHYRDMDAYLKLEKENQEKINRAYNATWNSANEFPNKLAGMMIDIICFLLFGSVISMLSPVIVLLLVAGSFINYFAQKYKQNKDYQDAAERDLVRKKINYITYSVSRDLKYGKDIRLYNLAGYFQALMKVLVKEHLHWLNKLQITLTLVSGTNFIITLLRDGLAYAFLIQKAVAGDVTTAEFVLYFSAITQVSGFIGGIIGNYANMRADAIAVSDFREFFDIKGRLNRDKGIKVDFTTPKSIEFKNVSYKYPEGQKNVLENINLKIEAGERIALVGLNGAGKTTLTKLCCGLLLPTEGEVLIDGHSVFEYNRDDLYAMFSLICQDYNILPMSIAGNVALCDESEMDVEKVITCLKTAGLWEKVVSLKNGINTQLDRQVDSDAVDLSGGEKQKLLFARALYRNAPILILDEPTAALDPIAEDAMYKRYFEVGQNKTSIFISHRLASTRFCDRIYLLDGAVLAESGSHAELMAKGGKYAELFNVQSRYYTEEVAQ
ncbi:MAG: ABC transporter ATP-binding protein [Eubacteriales bacterium]|jgi:ATP-binding cassette subfamily B protein